MELYYKGTDRDVKLASARGKVFRFPGTSRLRNVFEIHPDREAAAAFATREDPAA